MSTTPTRTERGWAGHFICAERCRFRRNTLLSDPSKGPEEIHRLVIRRSLPANEAAWSKHCPKPKDWKEQDDV